MLRAVYECTDWILIMTVGKKGRVLGCLERVGSGCLALRLIKTLLQLGGPVRLMMVEKGWVLGCLERVRSRHLAHRLMKTLLQLGGPLRLVMVEKDSCFLCCFRENVGVQRRDWVLRSCSN